eukprot:718358-Rhodomonas_salina.4
MHGERRHNSRQASAGSEHGSTKGVWEGRPDARRWRMRRGGGQYGACRVRLGTTWYKLMYDTTKLLSQKWYQDTGFSRRTPNFALQK